MKIIRYQPQRLTLEPANPAYKPLIFEGRQRRKVKNIGKYVGLIRRF